MILKLKNAFIRHKISLSHAKCFVEKDKESNLSILKIHFPMYKDL